MPRDPLADGCRKSTLSISTAWGEYFPCFTNRPVKVDNLRRYVQAETGIPYRDIEVGVKLDYGDGTPSKLWPVQDKVELDVPEVWVMLDEDRYGSHPPEDGPDWLFALRCAQGRCRQAEVLNFQGFGHNNSDCLLNSWRSCPVPFKVPLKSMECSVECRSMIKALAVAKADFFNDLRLLAYLNELDDAAECHKRFDCFDSTAIEPRSEWNRQMLSLCRDALRPCFKSNNDRVCFLLGTGNAVLLACGSQDFVLGAGWVFSECCGEFDGSSWRGRNIFGLALMELRDEFEAQLRCHDGGCPPRSPTTPSTTVLSSPASRERSVDTQPRSQRASESTAWCEVISPGTPRSEPQALGPLSSVATRRGPMHDDPEAANFLSAFKEKHKEVLSRTSQSMDELGKQMGIDLRSSLDRSGEDQLLLSDEVCKLFLARPWLPKASSETEQAAVWPLLQCAKVMEDQTFNKLLPWIVDNICPGGNCDGLLRWKQLMMEARGETTGPSFPVEILDYSNVYPEAVALGLLARDAWLLFDELEAWQKDFVLEGFVDRRWESPLSCVDWLRGLLAGRGIHFFAARFCIEEGEPESVVKILAGADKRELAAVFPSPTNRPCCYLELGLLLLEWRCPREVEGVIRAVVGANAFSDDGIKALFKRTAPGQLRHLSQLLISYVSTARQGSCGAQVDNVATYLFERIMSDMRKCLKVAKSGEDPPWEDGNVEDAIEACLLVSAGAGLREYCLHVDRATADTAKRCLGSWCRRRFVQMLNVTKREPGGLRRDGEYGVEELVSGQKPICYDARDCDYFGNISWRRRPIVLVQLFHACVNVLLALSDDESCTPLSSIPRDGAQVSLHTVDAEAKPWAEHVGILQVHFFVQKLCWGSSCTRDVSKVQILGEILPQGGALRKRLAEDVRKVLRVKVSASDISCLLGYVGFYHASFQVFLRDRDAQSAVRLRNERCVLLQATVKLLSFQMGHVVDVALTLRGICEDLDASAGASSSYEALLSQMLKEILDRPLQDFVPSSDADGGSFFSLEKLHAVADRLRQLCVSWTYETAAVRDAMARIFSAYLIEPMAAWFPRVCSLDTVLFCLKYVDKEDVGLAFQRFAIDNSSNKGDGSPEPTRWCFDALLTAAKAWYTKPLLNLSSENSNTLVTFRHDRVADLIVAGAGNQHGVRESQTFGFRVEDWKTIVKIAAAAAESMHEKFGILTLPHHTQMIALLIFSFLVRGSLNADPEVPKMLLAQVGTGEGKSWIIAMLAAFIGLKGRRVHVLIDSDSLLCRDCAAMAPFFDKLGLKVGRSWADLKNKGMTIVYCRKQDILRHCLEMLQTTSSYADASLCDAFLIADEVDGLIMDGDTNTAYVYEDSGKSMQANLWLDAHGDMVKVDSNSVALSDRKLYEELTSAYKEMLKKNEGVDYVVENGQAFSLSSNTKSIQRGTYAQWLELKRKQLNSDYKVVIKSPQAVICFPRCFKEYSHVFGLTGSLGRGEEQRYLRDAYGASHFRVPPFLDTCSDIGGKPFPVPIEESLMMQPSREAQIQAAVILAAEKCSQVPVLIIVEDRRSVSHIAKALREKLGEAYRDDGVLEVVPTSVGSDDGFARLVEMATKPLVFKSNTNGAREKKTWRVSVTTPEGARGHDYRVIDPLVDEKGGLLVIITYVPWSEREWAQFKGRTARQDHCGQYAVILNCQDEGLQTVCRECRSGGEVIEAALRQGDEKMRQKLEAARESEKRGDIMHTFTRVFLSQKNTLSKDGLNGWTDLCGSYEHLSRDEIWKKVPVELLKGVSPKEREDLRLWQPALFEEASLPGPYLLGRTQAASTSCLPKSPRGSKAIGGNHGKS